MSYRISIFSVLIACTAGFAHGQQSNSSDDQIYRDVSFLSHDSLEGRETGTKGEIIAANYIASRFEDLGLSSYGLGDSYFHTFSKSIKENPHQSFSSDSIQGRNVVGFLNGGHKGTIIIGAHFDHLGWGGEGSGSLSLEHAIHNGADDNASGIAALLYLAKSLQKKKLRHNLLFIAFSGEEKGLLGSNHFANNILDNPDSISFMINMDMIGNLDSNRRLAIYGVGTSPNFSPSIHKVRSPKFEFVVDSSGIGPSDHTSFYLQNIPVLHFFTGQHKRYHTPEDDVEFINFKGLEDVATYIRKLVYLLDKEDDLLFTATNDSRNNNEQRSFKVTLGIIPDYLFDGQGLKIDGVKLSRSADAAGILKGDIILQLGRYKIDNIYNYMDALEHYEPNETVNATILRAQEEISVEITFID